MNADKCDAPVDSSNSANDAPAPLVSIDGAPYEIPVEGSLGLLAIGYTGIMLWREKRRAVADAALQESAGS